MKFKLGIDILMTTGLLFLMPYELVGRSSHEWKGKYTKFHIVQTILALVIFITMIGSMISGIFLSNRKLYVPENTLCFL